MDNEVLNAFDAFQVADLDDDMVGMCKALVDWMKLVRSRVDSTLVPDASPPDRFYKMNPHQPRMELRKNLRKVMAHAVKYQEETDPTVRLLNVYVVVLAATYLYHMPTEKMVEASLVHGEFTRDHAQRMLLDDFMSPNWLKEPSGKDFTAIML